MMRSNLLPFLGVLVSSVTFLAGAKNCAAQKPPEECAAILSEIGPAGTGDFEVQIKSFTNVGAKPECFWQLATNNAPLRPSVLRSAYLAQKKVNTTQAGAASGSGGTTSAISKPITPLSLATEYGGITSSTNAQTVTLQAPLDGIPRALATHGLVSYCSTQIVSVPGCVQGKVLDKLNRFGVGVSMNTAAPSTKTSGATTGSAQGATQPVSLSSLGSQSPSLAGVFAKVTILRGTPKLPDISSLSPYGKAQADAAGQLVAYLSGNHNYEDWQLCVQGKLRSAARRDRVDAFNKYYAQIVGVLFRGATVDCSDNPSPNTAVVTAEAMNAQELKLYQYMQGYLAAAELTRANFDAAVLAAAAAPVLGFEYDLNTPQSQPTNSTFKLVGSVGWPTPPATANSSNATAPWTLTYNFGVSIYNSTPASTIPGASTLRDIQFGAEVDRNINSSKWPGLLGKIGDTTASLTYYLQYQSSPSILNVTPGSPLPGITITGLSSSATQVFTSKGTINVAQFKYALGKGTNAKFPIAVTYSNRTELITHPTWGVQFGVTYDLSSLMGTGSSK
jgi:hypothetical protein